MEPINKMQISEILQQYHLSDIKATAANGDTILHLVIKNKNLTPKETIEILGILLDEGLDPNAKNYEDETILRLAIANRAKDVIEFLLARDVHFEDSAAEYLIECEKYKTIDQFWENELPDSEWEKVENESNKFVEWCLSKGLNIDSRDRYGETGFSLALKRPLPHILPTVLKYTKVFDSLDCKTKNTLLYTFLIMFCEFWSSNYKQRHASAVVRMMLDEGVSLVTVDSGKTTVLHLAIELHEDISLIEILIERSANVNFKNAKGETPLLLITSGKCARYSTSKSKNDDFMKICHHLITKGADVNELDINGVSPLCFAFQYHDMKLVELLLERRADFNVITNFGQTLIHFLAQRTNYDSKTDEETSSQLFDMLASKCCNIHAKDNDGNTALHCAAYYNYVEMMKKLIEHGAEIEARNNEKKTRLRYLVDRRVSTDAAVLLLEHGANINSRSTESYTALCAAAAGSEHPKKSEMLQLLLKYGADFNTRTPRGYSVLDVAVWHEFYRNVDHDVGLCYFPNLERLTPAYLTDEVKLLLKHWIKLRVANLDCPTDDGAYESFITKEEFKRYLENCLKEVKTVKSTFIDSRTSLYSLLHMNLNNRRAYIYNEKLQQLVKSPKLEEQIPEFSVLILASYHEAVTRQRLMEPAKKAWFELIKISLPDECIELIFSFLSNSDLFYMIEKN